MFRKAAKANAKESCNRPEFQATRPSSEPGSRAASFVADEHFCANVVNPTIECLSQSLTKAVQRRYEPGLVAWFPPAKAHDAEMSLQEWKTGLQFGVVSGNEYRVSVLNLESRPELEELRDALRQSY